ncbi:hypothetical protein NGRA_1860 [Nosema granulosis]|uniref:Rad21/Rec8-like protein N-terminal domain-containing protein n=1 Tax=Nosema granulosis TaxID=83296 RepID=A0A9P6GXM9_9MICR|nr:hypothetical protein NGRA_1860 [Nosema granulosis]
MEINTLKETINKIIYSDKKVLKSSIKKMDLNELINLSLQLADMSYVVKNRLVLGLVKIFVRKFKYLLDDGNELLLKISHRESIRVVKNKNINLKLESNAYYVTDNLLEEKEVVCQDDWVDFDNLSVEAMRDESGGVGSTLIESLVENPKKKRKIIEDEITEYDPVFYKRNVCNTKNIVETCTKTFNVLRGGLKIADVFLQNIDILKAERLSEVEQIRDQTMFDTLDVADPFDISLDGDHHTSEEIQEHSVLDLNSDFIFNTNVIELPKLDKAKEFLRLLGMASERKVRCIQESPFSPILCKKVE